MQKKITPYYRKIKQKKVKKYNCSFKEERNV